MAEGGAAKKAGVATAMDASTRSPSAVAQGDLAGPRGPVRIPPHQLQPVGLELLRSHTDWRRDWTHIVAGRFSDSPYSGLLFYEQSTGVAEFYATDGQGGISLLRQHEGWRTSWTHVVPGFFGPSGFSGLLLYDQAAGFGAFYDTDGQGEIVLLREHGGWRTSWTLIVGGRFTASAHTGLLFYERDGAYGEIYATDGAGGIELLATYDDWRTSWTQIVAGEFFHPEGWEDPAIDDLFFWEGSTGYGETYRSDGQGGTALEAAEAGLPPATHIVAGSFGGSGPSNLLFYDRATGAATFRDLPDLPGAKTWVPLDSFAWPEAWDTLVAGNFWMADPEDHHFADGAFTDLLLYAQAAGRGDFCLYEPPEPTPEAPFAGYVSSRSVLPADIVGFHVSSRVGRYKIGVHRLGPRAATLGEVADLPAAPTPLPIGRTAYKNGAGWPVAGSLTIPADAPSGLYVGRVETPPIVIGGRRGREAGSAYARRAAAPAALAPGWPFPSASLDIPFVVRAPAGRRARILLAVADTTIGASTHGSIHPRAPTARRTASGPRSSAGPPATTRVTARSGSAGSCRSCAGSTGTASRWISAPRATWNSCPTCSTTTGCS